jgi:hypothetical protein
VGYSHCHDYREADLLNLGAEHIPFPCSLRELVLDRYAEPPGAGANAHPMKLEELIGYLTDIDDFSVSPWIAVMERTEAIGDPATPSREHTAILRWLGKALEIWEKEFPLESRMANQLRRLKPLAAALAVTDANFLKPGAHPLHQLLDTIQARAIGWQSRLDRVGTALEEQVTLAVDRSREWFVNPGTDLKLVCDEFTSAAERDQARALRMVQRVVDTEAGKVRTAAAKQDAAGMINSFLEKFPAPAEIGEFIKGPWYTSAQLLLLKFGKDSEHWKNMCATTETLLDSLQSLDEADDQRRQHIFESVTQLPKEMRRWLLSLHHDTEAVNEAMGMVEFVHLRILRKQPVEMQDIEPIVVETDHTSTGGARHSNAMKKWPEGQWFLVENDGSILRVQLVLKIEPSQQLLFANMAGLKVLQLSFEEFSQLIFDKQATPLYSGASFSLSMARAAGVNTAQILEALTSAMADSELETEAAPEPKPDPDPNGEAQVSVAAEANSNTAFTADLLPIEGDDPFPSAEFQEDESLQAPDLGDMVFESAESAPPDIPQHEAEEVEQQVPQEEERQELQEEQWERQEEQQKPREEEAPQGFLADRAREIGAKGGYTQGTGTTSGAASSGLSQFEQDSRRFLSDPEPRETPSDSTEEPIPTAPDEALDSELPDSSAAPGGARERRIDLPVGVWIGFHDGETPMMARLAVQDPEADHFIFVNRKGVKVRQVSGQEFLDLIDRKLVEILETSTNFRDAVSEVRKNRDQ